MQKFKLGSSEVSIRITCTANLSRDLHVLYKSDPKCIGMKDVIVVDEGLDYF